MVLDGKGMIRHDGGITDSPGMYLIGTPFLRRRKSSFIDGAGTDAQELIVELTAYLDRRRGAGTADGPNGAEGLRAEGSHPR